MHHESTPYPLCACGCGKPVKTKGGTYLRGHHHYKGPRYSVEDRGHETPCWIWQGIHAGQQRPMGYDRSTGRKVYAYRLFYEQKNGPLGDREIDHVCKVPQCVNPDHLRPATSSQNKMNRPSKGGSSKFKGVDYRPSRGKFRSRIMVERKTLGLGHFATEEEAARAYDRAARLLHGDFAVLNFPDEVA